MIENPDQRCKVPILQILKIGLGHQCAGKIVFPLHAQQRRFQRAQIALLQPQLPQAAGGEQHVRVTGGDAVIPNAMHEKTGLEQRHVEGFPVEGTKHGKTLHPGGQQVEHGFFVGVVPHEKLLHRKASRSKITQPHLKGHRACAAGQPCGLRVQKEHVLRRNRPQETRSRTRCAGFPAWRSSRSPKVDSGNTRLRGGTAPFLRELRPSAAGALAGAASIILSLFRSPAIAPTAP